MTEFYNLLEFQCRRDENANSIKDLIIAPIRQFKTNKVLLQVQKYIENWKVPVLTTNYDYNLETGYTRHILRHPKNDNYRVITSYYPSDRYYSYRVISDPSRDFAFWQINGFLDFNQSIKLSFSEYMAQVSYARKYLHKLYHSDDFELKDRSYWNGYNTWLHAFFNCSLCVFGLKLDEDETFLRWLFIERKKYFRKFPDRAKGGWYINKE